METYDDFIANCKLNENGEFQIQIPAESRNKPLIVQIKSINTILPFNFKNEGTLCSDYSESTSNDSKVEILRIQPDFLPFFDNYTSRNFMNSVPTTTASEDRLRKNFSAAFNYSFIESKINKLSIDKIFNADAINNIYNKFNEFDVVIFAEYGVSLNYSGRLKSTTFTNNETFVTADKEVNNGIRSMDSRIYGFKLGFKFIQYYTSPYLEPSVLSHQFMSNLFENDEDKFGFYDMIRFVLSDIGEYEWFAQPDVNQYQFRREGYGLYIFFEKLGTYLQLTFTAGALPYVITEEDFPNINSVNLPDRDYGDISLTQNLCILRETKSRLASSPGEYLMSYSFTQGDSYFKQDKPFFRSFQPEIKNVMKLLNNYIFDSPISFQPLFDIMRNGNFLNLPVYGGITPYLSMFYAFNFFTHHNFENQVARDESFFFLTGTGFMNFLSGNFTNFVTTNGFYPFTKNSDGTYDEDTVRKNVLNPELKGNDFIRVSFIQILRNRSYGKKISDLLKNSVSAVGLLVKNIDSKYLLTGQSKFDTQIGCVEVIPTIADYYPVRDLTNFNMINLLPPEPKPLFSDKPFQFYFQPYFNSFKDIINFKFCAFNTEGEILKVKFEENDEVVLKGTFVYKN